jgi:hypothetical protein
MTILQNGGFGETFIANCPEKSIFASKQDGAPSHAAKSVRQWYDQNVPEFILTSLPSRQISIWGYLYAGTTKKLQIPKDLGSYF